MAFKPGKRFSIGFEELLPAGCVLAGGVSPVTDFEVKKGDNQKRDAATGFPLWQVAVFDADPDARDGQREMRIKIAAEHQPVPPGGPLTPVEFTGLSVVPWINEKGIRPRIEFSIYADGMRAVASGRSGKGSSSNASAQPAAA